MKNLFRDSEKLIYSNATGTGIEAGDAIDGGTVIAVAYGDIADGADGTVALEGQYELAKEPSVAFAQFNKLYWDAINSRLTKTAGTSTYAGICAVAADAADTTAICLINRGTV